MATSFTRRMNWTPLGEAFTDYPLDSVGVTAFQLRHDLFIREELAIRTAPAGGGTLLVEDTGEGGDYVLSGEDYAISALVTEAVGTGRKAKRWITVTNAAYQACALYASGKYVLDALDKEDGEEIITLSDENYTLPDGTHDVHIDLTTVAVEREITLGALARNLGRTITLQMNNASIVGYEGKLTPPVGEHFFYQGAEYDNLYVGLPGQRVSIKIKADGLYIIGGVVQPVALEPDIGGGWHSHPFHIWTSFDPADANWHEITSLSAELPVGVRIVRKFGYFFSAGGVRLMYFSSSDAGALCDQHINATTSTYGQLAGHLHLSSTKSFWYQANNADISNIDMWVSEYLLGPA